MAKYCMKCMEPTGGVGKCPHCGYEGDQNTAPHRLPPGTILNDRYLVGNAIGQGGFGITYMGRDLKLNMRVAVKEYYPNGYANRNASVSSEITISDKDQADFIEKGKKKFLSEAQALAQFHENAGVVDVRDFFEANQTAYIVMEYLDGQDLREALKKKLFSADEIFRIMGPVMGALEKIHDAGIVHRDISPDNIMLLKNGTVKLMDFGAARLLDFSDQKSVSVVLKAGYAPEEQYRPKGKQGPWTDIYALCATIYKCITGITPDDALERSHKDQVQWPSELGVAITPLQEAVLKKGMAVKQEERFQNISEMKAMLGTPDAKIHSLELETDDDVLTEYWEHKAGGEKKGETENTETRTDAVKKRIPAIIGVCVAAAVLAGAFIFGGKKNTLPEDRVPDTAAAETGDGITEPPVFDSGQYIHIVLNAGENISVKGYNDALEILKERLDIFCGNREYGMDIVGDRVSLHLPKECFGDYDVQKILRCYLTRAIDFYAFNKVERAGYNPERFMIGRGDLQEVTLIDGAIEGVKASEYGVDAEEYTYLKLVLTDACAEKYQNEIEAWGNQLTFAQDMSVDSYYYYHTFPAGDGKTFYILNNDVKGRCNDLMLYNLTHEPLEESFTYRIDLSYQAAWEDAETAQMAGENQYSVNEINGDTVTFYYTSSNKDMTAGEVLDTEAAFKERLDALGQPYAFGWREDGTRTSVAVKTGLGHMGEPILEALKESSGAALYAGLLKEALYSSGSHTFSYEKQEDGTYQVSLQIGSYDAEKTVETVTTELEKAGGGELILMLADRPYLSVYVDQTLTGNTLVFDQVYLPEKGAVTEDNLWVVRFVETVLCGTKLPSSFMFNEGDYFVFSDTLSTDDVPGFGISYDSMGEETEETLNRELEEESEVWVYENSLRVQFDLEVNETLPETAVRLGREVYEKTGFEDSSFNELVIYLMKEDDEKKERARIIFTKNYAPAILDDKYRFLYVHGIFSNGRLERYEEMFKELIEADEFYRKLEDAYPYGDELWQYD